MTYGPRLLSPTVSHRHGLSAAMLRGGLEDLFSPAEAQHAAAFSVIASLNLDEAVERIRPRIGLVSALPRAPDKTWHSYGMLLQARDAITHLMHTGCFDVDILHVGAQKGESVFALFTPWCVVLQTQDVVRAARTAGTWTGTGTRAPHHLATLCFPAPQSAHQRLEQVQTQDRALRLLLRARPQTQEALDLLGIGFSFPSETVAGA